MTGPRAENQEGKKRWVGVCGAVWGFLLVSYHSVYAAGAALLENNLPPVAAATCTCTCTCGAAPVPVYMLAHTCALEIPRQAHHWPRAARLCVACGHFGDKL